MNDISGYLFPEQITLEKETLIIVGNGFDLAHRIKSSFKDFKDWFYPGDVSSYHDLLSYFFGAKHDFWSDVENALGEYDEEQILSFCRPNEDFDFDRSLSFAARVEDSPMDIFLPEIDDLRSGFTDWVNSIDIRGVDKKYSLSPLCRYLSFNYTDTLETIYDIPEEQVVHIHGYRGHDAKLVMGHNNIRDSKEPWIEDGTYFEQQAKEYIIDWMNEFYKDYDSNIKRHKAFFDGLKTVTQIIVYGHSMGKIDWPYFDYIINVVGKDVPWIINGFSVVDLKVSQQFQEHFNISNLKFIMN